MEEEDQPNCVTDWPFLYKEKSTEELAQSLWSTTMELEATIDQLNQLKHLLNDAIIERNEARNKYQSLLIDNLLLQQQFHNHHHHQTTVAPPHSGVSSIEDDRFTAATNCGGFSSSDCEESILSSPPPPPPAPEEEFRFPAKMLPEKGKFLEAVMKAAPLLQNLLLAGPLPHWRHPPPPLDTGYQIPSPPLVIPAPSIQHLISEECLRKIRYNYGELFNKKRGFSEDRDSSSTETINKYQRILP